MFTATKRYIKDGRLIAFEGETMTDDEAAARGILDKPKPARKPARKRTVKKEQ